MGRLVKASIAVGLAIIGVVLVWVALARPSTPDSALAGAPNGHSMPSTSPSAPKPTAERPTARADEVDVRDQTKGLVLPASDPVAVSIPRIGVRSRLVELGLDPRWRDGAARRPCRRWLVLSRGHTRCSRAGRHRWARDVGRRSCGLLPPRQPAARRSGVRHPKGWENCRLHCHPGGPILEVAVPEPGGLRRHRPCWTATDHVWRHLRRSQAQLPGQRRCLRQAGGGARASWLMTGRGQPLIMSTKGLGRHAGVGVQHAKPVATRLAQLDIGRELARLVGLRG